MHPISQAVGAEYRPHRVSTAQLCNPAGRQSLNLYGSVRPSHLNSILTVSNPKRAHLGKRKSKMINPQSHVEPHVLYQHLFLGVQDALPGLGKAIHGMKTEKAGYGVR